MSKSMSVDLTTPIKSEHLVSITVSRAGALVEADYLDEIIRLGIDEHNAKVRQHGTQDGDYEITVLGTLVSEDLSQGNLVMTLDDGDTHSALSGSSIREVEDEDEDVLGPPIFEF